MVFGNTSETVTKHRNIQLFTKDLKSCLVFPKPFCNKIITN